MMQSEVLAFLENLVAIPSLSSSTEHLRMQLEECFGGMGADSEVSTLTTILQRAVAQGENYHAVAALAWERLNAGERWRVSFNTVEEMRSYFQWDRGLEKIVSSFLAYEQLRIRTDSNVKTFWHCSLESVFPSLPSPAGSRYSKHFLNYVQTLVKNSSKTVALNCLSQVREDRMRVAQSRNGSGFIAVDFQRAIAQLKVHGSAHYVDETLAEDISTSKEKAEFGNSISGDSTSCSCPTTLLIQLARPTTASSSAKPNRIYATLRLESHRLCHRHLRILMGNELGMCTNTNHDKLLSRLAIYMRARDSGTESRLRKIRHGWFRGGSSATPANSAMGMRRFMPHPKESVPQLSFSPEHIFRRYTRADAYGKWLSDGTVILDGIFDYITSNEETFKVIKQEFDLYKYHTRDERHGKKRNGWIRTMFYSVIQQVVRQDPVYYALIVAACPDLNWRLVSYPYYTKDTSLGENTGFKHLDLNVPRLLVDGRGGNIIQSRVSLDNEEVNGCTIVVPGFHRYIREWWGQVEARGSAANGLTTCVSKIYTKQDISRYGNFIPTPCRRGGIRITRPEILHGSTPHSLSRRRTMLPCFIAVSRDHETLENEECETWSDLAACHLMLQAPKRSTSGYGMAYGGPGFRFPAAVQLASSSAIGDAIICARRWDDPLVLEEIKILLGPCDESARRYVESCRKKLVSNYIHATTAVFEMERQMYGLNSFAVQGAWPDTQTSDDDTYSALGLSDDGCNGSDYDY